MKILILASLLCAISSIYAHPQVLDLPAGLKPAKAFGDSEKAIIPGQEETTPAPPANARVPPNLSLRSRMMAALNSPVGEVEQPSPNIEESTPKAPLIFQKRKNGKKVTASPFTKAKSTMTPPPGRDFVVHSLVQTNLIDSKGRLLKGVKSVPIHVQESKTPKPRAKAVLDESEAEKIVPIKFEKKRPNRV